MQLLWVFFGFSITLLLLTVWILKQVSNSLCAPITMQLILLQLNCRLFPKSLRPVLGHLTNTHEKQKHTPEFPYYCSVELSKRPSFSPQSGDQSREQTGQVVKAACYLIIANFSNASVAHIYQGSNFTNITGSHIALKKKCRRLSYILLSLVKI